MKPLKKNDRLIDLATQTEWTFDCKTRGPDLHSGSSRPVMTWTYIFRNNDGHRRFIPERELAGAFQRKEK